MAPYKQGIGRVLGSMRKRFSRRTKRLMATAVLALPVAAGALGWADHSHITPLIWLFSPGLPIALHVSVPASGFLDAVAKVGMLALLIDFAYYTALIFAGLSWISGHTAQWLEAYLKIQPDGPNAEAVRTELQRLAKTSAGKH